MTTDSTLNARRPRIGIALGGGAALGLAHIGLLRVLMREGLEPDLVVGTSMGAVVGAAYVSGELDALEDLARAIDWRKALRLTDVQLGHNGLLRGRGIEQELKRYLGDKVIEDLPKPFCAVATELARGEVAPIDRGSLVEAVRASISLPGIFVPVRRGERVLVDGGLLNNVPVDIVREMGADIVIGVNVTADFAGFAAHAGLHDFLRPEAERRGWRANVWSLIPRWMRRWPLLRRLDQWASEPSLLAVTLTSVFLMMRALSFQQNQLHPADCYICPPLGHLNPAEFHRADELIALGAQAMERHLDALRSAVAAAGEGIR